MATTEHNLYKKLLAITEEIGKIDKTGTNSMQGYKFIEQAQVVAEVRVQLAKHGVMIIPETIGRELERHEVTRSNGKPGVDVHAKVVSRYTLVNADNPDERMVCEWDAGEAIDSGDKATNKATTASHKYFLMKLFNISDKDDPDADSPTAVAAKNAGLIETSLAARKAYDLPQRVESSVGGQTEAPGVPEATISTEQMAELMELARKRYYPTRTDRITVKKEIAMKLDGLARPLGLFSFTHLSVTDFEAFKKLVIEAGWGEGQGNQ